MAADYLVASLQPLTLDGPAPYTMERFLEMCAEQLGKGSSDCTAPGCAAPGGAAPSMAQYLLALAERWADVDAQLRNAIAAERARARNQDPAKWRRPADGCSVYWANRVAQAFQEKDPARREDLLDRVRWDAAGELVPPAAPLSAAAAFAYALRLEIVIRRRARSVEAGNATFDRLAAATKVEF